MNIIIINGSAKRGGECEKLIEMFNEGISAKIISVFSENISPCTDCGFCGNTEKCVIKDNMQKYYNDIIEADLIVLASPVYFSSLTGVMLNFLSRFQVFFLNGDIIKKKKKAVLLLTGGGATKKLDIIERQTKIALTTIKGELEETAAYMETDKKSVTESYEIKKRIEEIKRKYGLI